MKCWYVVWWSPFQMGAGFKKTDKFPLSRDFVETMKKDLAFKLGIVNNVPVHHDQVVIVSCTEVSQEVFDTWSSDAKTEKPSE